MKIRSIIWSALAVMGMLAACTSEEIIDTPVLNVGSVTVQFTTAGASTKADAAEEPNRWATAAETTINNYMVAVFEGETLQANSKCIKLVEGVVNPSTTTESETGSTDGQTVKAYSTTVTDLPVDTKLSFLVIANAETAQLPKVWRNDLTYSSFEKVETTSSFAASKLLKVGKKEGQTLSASATVSVVKVPLIQLTARIDFAGVQYTDQGGEDTETNAGSWEKVTGNSLKSLYDTYFAEGKDNTPQKVELNEKVGTVVENKGGEYVYDDDGYLYFNSTGSNWWNYYENRLSIEKGTKKTTVTSPSTFVLTETTVGNLNHKSDILIYDTLSVENNESDLRTATVAFDKSFYTYELAQASENILLGVKGGLASSKKITEVIEYRIQLYQKNSSTGKYKTKGNVMTLSSLGSSIEKGEETTPPSTTTEYTLSIPYTKIIKGNLYKVTGKFNPSVSPTIEWEVVDMDNVPVVIPPFQ